MLPTNFPISCLCRKTSAPNECVYTVCRVGPDPSSVLTQRAVALAPKEGTGGSRWLQSAATSQLTPLLAAGGFSSIFLQHKDKLLMVNLFNFKLYQRRELSCSQVCDSQELERTQPLFLTHPHWVFTGINCMTAALPLRAYTFRLLSDYQLA